jgi:subtilisin-like proprotein convertase family protein
MMPRALSPFATTCMKLRFLSFMAGLLASHASQAQIVQTTSFVPGVGGVTFAGDGLVPDGNPAGWSDTRSIAMPVTTLTSVRVGINLDGGYNGDLYGYLSGPGTGFAVLFNRVGRDTGDEFGYGDEGMNLTFSADGAADIHGYQSVSYLLNGAGQLTGNWQPDGRSTDPASVLDTSPRDALLISFLGANPNSDWTLFIADLSGGEQTSVASWFLEITAVPEPATTATAAAACLLGAALLRRRRGPPFRSLADTVGK